MVAINSIPQQEVANGKGHSEFLRAIPTTFSRLVAKNPAPSYPSGFSTSLISVFLVSVACIVIYFFHSDQTSPVNLSTAASCWLHASSFVECPKGLQLAACSLKPAE